MDLSLDAETNVWTLVLKSSPAKGGFENRFNPDFIAGFNAALDRVEEGGGALVTTSEGKFYSNGLDLNWLMHQPKGGPEARAFMASFHLLLARVLTFPCPTVAALNGHGFAGGFMLALAHDYRVMRRDRGFLCMNEIELGMTLTPGMNAIIKCKVPPPLWREVMLQGHRFSGEEAAALHLVDEAADEAGVLPAACAIAERHCDRYGDTYGGLKRDLYVHCTAVLEDNGSPFAGLNPKL
jgi:enoyl-CoA hydratase/carnithine racemase